MDEHLGWRCNLGFTGDSRAQMEKVLVRWRAAFPEQDVKADSVFAVGDFVIVEETLRAKHEGKFGPFAPTGHTITWHMAEIWEMHGDKIARGWSYANFREALPQLGGEDERPATKPPCSVDP
jgi:predicted ester cyclase